MATELTVIQKRIERSLYEAIRLILVELGYLPDILLYTNDALGQANWAAALSTVKVDKGFAIELFGVGSSEKKYEKQVPRIVIQHRRFTKGTIGNSPHEYVRQLDGSYELIKNPTIRSVGFYDVHIVANSAEQERIQHAVVNAALGAMGYILFWDFANDNDRFMIEEVGQADNYDYPEGIMSKVYSYLVPDLQLASSKVVSVASSIEEITIEELLGESEVVEETIIVGQVTEIVILSITPSNSVDITVQVTHAYQGIVIFSSITGTFEDTVYREFHPFNDGDITDTITINVENEEDGLYYFAATVGPQGEDESDLQYSAPFQYVAPAPSENTEPQITATNSGCNINDSQQYFIANIQTNGNSNVGHVYKLQYYTGVLWSTLAQYTGNGATQFSITYTGTGIIYGTYSFRVLDITSGETSNVWPATMETCDPESITLNSVTDSSTSNGLSITIDADFLNVICVQGNPMLGYGLATSDDGGFTYAIVGMYHPLPSVQYTGNRTDELATQLGETVTHIKLFGWTNQGQEVYSNALPVNIQTKFWVTAMDFILGDVSVRGQRVYEPIGLEISKDGTFTDEASIHDSQWNLSWGNPGVPSNVFFPDQSLTPWLANSYYYRFYALDGPGGNRVYAEEVYLCNSYVNEDFVIITPTEDYMPSPSMLNHYPITITVAPDSGMYDIQISADPTFTEGGQNATMGGETTGLTLIVDGFTIVMGYNYIRYRNTGDIYWSHIRRINLLP